jgi:hypothetical protein
MPVIPTTQAVANHLSVLVMDKSFRLTHPAYQTRPTQTAEFERVVSIRPSLGRTRIRNSSCSF